MADDDQFDEMFALVHERMEAERGLSWTEAAVVAVDWLKRNGLEAEYIRVYGAAVIGAQCNHHNRRLDQRAAPVRATPTAITAPQPVVNAHEDDEEDERPYEPPPPRMGSGVRDLGHYRRLMKIGDAWVKTGDMTKAQCFIVAKDYRKQAGNFNHLADFWFKIAAEMGSVVRVRDQWHESTFSVLMKKAQIDGCVGP